MKQLYVESINNKDNYSLLIIQLYNFLLAPTVEPHNSSSSASSSPSPSPSPTYIEDRELENLNLNSSDCIIFADKIVKHFFALCLTMNDENSYEHVVEINETLKLVRNMCLHLASYRKESSPFRNILIRTLITELFNILKNPKVISLNKIKSNSVELFFVLI
jgi:hypothetical protein